MVLRVLALNKLYSLLDLVLTEVHSVFVVQRICEMSPFLN